MLGTWCRAGCASAARRSTPPRWRWRSRWSTPTGAGSSATRARAPRRCSSTTACTSAGCSRCWPAPTRCTSPGAGGRRPGPGVRHRGGGRRELARRALESRAAGTKALATWHASPPPRHVERVARGVPRQARGRRGSDRAPSRCCATCTRSVRECDCGWFLEHGRLSGARSKAVTARSTSWPPAAPLASSSSTPSGSRARCCAASWSSPGAEAGAGHAGGRPAPAWWDGWPSATRSNDARTSASASSWPTQLAPSTDLPGSRSL